MFKFIVFVILSLCLTAIFPAWLVIVGLIIVAMLTGGKNAKSNKPEENQ